MLRSDADEWDRRHQSEPTPAVYSLYFTKWDGQPYAEIESDFRALNNLALYAMYGDDPTLARQRRRAQLRAISLFSKEEQSALLRRYVAHAREGSGTGRFKGFLQGNAHLLGGSGAAARLELLRLLRGIFLADEDEAADRLVELHIKAQGSQHPANRLSERLFLVRPDLYPVCNKPTISILTKATGQNVGLAKNYLRVALALRLACAEEDVSLAALDRFITAKGKIPKGVHARSVELFSEAGNESDAADAARRFYVEKGIAAELVRTFRRNRALVARARKRAQGRCEACGIDTLDTYATDLIEVHHLERFADLAVASELTIADVAALCPNCHRAVHALGTRRRPLAPSELARRLRK